MSPYCSGSKRLLVFRRETKHGEMCHLTAVVVKDYWYLDVKHGEMCYITVVVVKDYWYLDVKHGEMCYITVVVVKDYWYLDVKHGEMCYITVVVVKDYWCSTLKQNVDRCITCTVLVVGRLGVEEGEFLLVANRLVHVLVQSGDRLVLVAGKLLKTVSMN